MKKEKATALRGLFGAQVRAFRNERGMTQGDLAGVSDLSLDMISRLERGTVGPSFETMVNLSEILDVPVSVLLGGSSLHEGTDSERENALLKIHRLLADIHTDELQWIESVIRAALKK